MGFNTSFKDVTSLKLSLYLFGRNYNEKGKNLQVHGIFNRVLAEAKYNEKKEKSPSTRDFSQDQYRETGIRDFNFDVKIIMRIFFLNEHRIILRSRQ